MTSNEEKANDYFKKGESYSDDNNYDQAIEAYTGAIKLDPSNAKAYHGRGYCLAYNGKGNYDRAIADFTEAIRLDPNFSKAYADRGLVYYDEGNFDQAIKDYSEAIRLDPNFAEAYFWRGSAYAGIGDHEKAIADETLGKQLDPYLAPSQFEFKLLCTLMDDANGDIKLLDNSIFKYRIKDDYAIVVKVYTQAIQNNQNDTEAYIYRGFAYANMGKYGCAIADFETALQLEPDNAYAKKLLKVAQECCN